MQITHAHWRRLWMQEALAGKPVRSSYVEDLLGSSAARAFRAKNPPAFLTLDKLEEATGHDPRQGRLRAALEAALQRNAGNGEMPERFTVLVPWARKSERIAAGWAIGFDYAATAKHAVFHLAPGNVRGFGWVLELATPRAITDFLHINMGAELLPGKGSNNFDWVLACGSLRHRVPNNSRKLALRSQVSNAFEAAGFPEVAATILTRSF